MKVIQKITLRNLPSVFAGFLCVRKNKVAKRMDFRSSKYLRVVGSAALAGLLILFVMMVMPLYYIETSVEATAGAPNESVLTFVSDNSQASVNLSISSIDGSFATSADGTGSAADQRARFSISTNNYTGYTLRVASNGDVTSLTNDLDSTKAILSITDENGIDAATFDTVNYNNKWGYMPSSYYNGSSNVANTTLYFPAPTIEKPQVLAVTDAPNSSNGRDNADEYTIGLGIRADYNNPSGTYVNDTFIIQFVANTIPYNITFSDNTGDSSVTGLPVALSGDTTMTKVALPFSTPTRTGYEFSGWCLGNVSNSGTVCDGTMYNAGSDFGIDKTTNNTVTLHAVWVASKHWLGINVLGAGVLSVRVCAVSGDCSGDDVKGVVYSDGGGVSDLDYGVAYYLYPNFASGYELNSWSSHGDYDGTLSSTSDFNPTFTIGNGDGLVDIVGQKVCNPSGNNINDIVCMQDISSTNKAAVFSSMTEDVGYSLRDNRDNKNYYVTRLADGNIWMTQNLDLDIDSNKTYTPADTDIPANWTPSRSTYATSVTTWNGYSASPESYDPGNLCWDGIVASSGDHKIACDGSVGDPDHYSLGNYYNWTAAVAMNDSSSYTTQNQDVNQSICPAGWTLPKSGTVQTGSGSFQYLKDQLGLTAGMSGNIQEYPVSFTYSGYWYGESYVGTAGYYWSPVVYGDYSSYNLAFSAHEESLKPQYAGGSGSGYSVRCVAR